MSNPLPAGPLPSMLAEATGCLDDWQLLDCAGEGAAGADNRLHCSVLDARRKLARLFRGAGIESADADARLLVSHALGLDHAALVAQAQRTLALCEQVSIAALARRRLRREPVARILGRKEFWSLTLALNDDTLVPRAETETVVEAALKSLAVEKTRQLRIADLGTGSGALLLALLSELPEAHGVGTDISESALACARANAQRLGFSCRAQFVCCDQGTALAGGFDLVVANPPYVSHDDIALLQSEVRDFDPRGALDGGADGLAAYRAIAADARRLLAPGAALVLELGAGQLGAVVAILAAHPGLAVDGEALCDLAGIARALVVRRLHHEGPSIQVRKKALGLSSQKD